MPEQLTFQIQFASLISGTPQLVIYLLQDGIVPTSTEIFNIYDSDDEERHYHIEARKAIKEMFKINVTPGYCAPNFEIVRGLGELEEWLKKFFSLSDTPDDTVKFLIGHSMISIKNRLMELHAIDSRSAGYI